MQPRSELHALLAFMRLLTEAGLSHNETMPRAFDYAILLYHANEEKQTKRGSRIPASRQIEIMDSAAALLKEAHEIALRGSDEQH